MYSVVRSYQVRITKKYQCVYYTGVALNVATTIKSNPLRVYNVRGLIKKCISIFKYS